MNFFKQGGWVIVTNGRMVEGQRSIEAGVGAGASENKTGAG